MALHPEFPKSPYAEFGPEHRWFPAAEELRGTATKFDLLRFGASGAASRGMFDDDWPRYVLKMAARAGPS